VPRDRLLPDLLEGRGDVAAANLTVTPERRELVDFSVPYIRDVREVVVTGPAAPAVRTLEGLAGQEVPVRPSSSYHASLTALDARLREAGLPSLRLTPVDEHLEDEDLLEMVNAGVLPFAVVDDLKARLWAQVLPDVVVRDDLVLREGGEIAFAVRKDSPRLKAALDEFVGRTGRGTTFGNVVFRRYFEGTGTLGNATAREDRERFRELAGLFRRYGERYGFEPLLLAALGYQESRLDPRARSPAGAVGVMQLLPKIARDPSVGIPDIRPPRVTSTPPPSTCASSPTATSPTRGSTGPTASCSRSPPTTPARPGSPACAAEPAAWGSTPTGGSTTSRCSPASAWAARRSTTSATS
jgi:membrane-bound lytic murein transglycosylase MltF